MASIIKSDNGVSSGITGIVQSADSSGQLSLQTTTSSGTATTAVTIDNTQKVTFANSIGFGSNAGITFNNSSALTNSTLNDYETGTFSPTITYATPGTLSVTYINNTGHYIKIGKLVYINLDVRVATFSKGTASGAWGFAGIPFACENDGGYNNFNTTCVQFVSASYNTSNLPISSLNSSGGTTVFMYTMVSGSYNGNQNDPANGAIYQMTLFYETAT